MHLELKLTGALFKKKFYNGISKVSKNLKKYIYM
jgi:hypothetical protein